MEGGGADGKKMRLNSDSNREVFWNSEIQFPAEPTGNWKNVRRNAQSHNHPLFHKNTHFFHLSDRLWDWGHLWT